MTPLIKMPKLGKEMNIPNLYMKDEGIIPTGSFKARGAAVGVSIAKELGVEQLAMPTNGNAGAAWSLYSSRADIKATVVMPKDAPVIARNECAVAGELEGSFICPEGAATFLAARRLREEGWIKENETVVALNTGLGVKYPNMVDIEVPVLERNGSLTKK